MSKEVRFFELYYSMDNAEENEEEIKRNALDAWPADKFHDMGVNNSGEFYVHLWARCEGLSDRDGASALFEHIGENIRSVGSVSGYEPKYAQPVGVKEVEGEHALLKQKDEGIELGLFQ